MPWMASASCNPGKQVFADDCPVNSPSTKHQHPSTPINTRLHGVYGVSTPCRQSINISSTRRQRWAIRHRVSPPPYPCDPPQKWSRQRRCSPARFRPERPKECRIQGIIRWPAHWPLSCSTAWLAARSAALSAANWRPSRPRYATAFATNSCASTWPLWASTPRCRRCDKPSTASDASNQTRRSPTLRAQPARRVERRVKLLRQPVSRASAKPHVRPQVLTEAPMLALLLMQWFRAPPRAA